MKEILEYDELPPTTDGGRSAWGLFGADDNVGLLNLQQPEEVITAARLVRKGKVFALDLPLNSFQPTLAPTRGTPRHTVVHRTGSFSFDDILDNFYPQGSSQWDSLGHAGYASDAFYNGATEEDILAGRRNTIEHWARKGIVGRAVLLDLARSLADDGRPYSPGDPVAFSAADLELARQRAGVQFAPGDVLLLHTGFAEWYFSQPEGIRLELPRRLTAAGIDHTQDVARYLWNAHVCAVGSDTYAVEVWPPDMSAAAAPFGFLHRVLIGQFGMALAELLWLKDLAENCAEDNVCEMMFVSAPLHIVGGIGSPANSIAIK